MGTRHLIAVYLDGDYKVAQYGQWDGYPEGQGASVLSFLRMMPVDTFKTKLRACSFLTDEEVEAINARIKDEGIGERWKEIWPELSRDAGSDILGMVLRSENGLKLNNRIKFAGASLFCEFAYVVDLDKGVLEVFKGFNKTPLDASERFYGVEQESPDYFPVRLIATFELSKLPTDEEFLSAVDPETEEEE